MLETPECHEMDSENCKACWDGFPTKCKCGGLVHAELFDEDYDNLYFCYECNKCGDDYDFDQY